MRVKILIVWILLAAFMSSCGSSSEKDKYKLPDDYAYMAVFTSFRSSHSEFRFYSDDWKLIRTLKLSAGGVTPGKTYKGNYYFVSTGTPRHSGNQIIELNSQLNKLVTVPTSDYPMDVAIQRGYAFVIHNTDISYGELNKIDLASGKIVKQIKVPGVLRTITSNQDRIYVLSDHIQERMQHISVYDSELHAIHDYKNRLTTFSTDTFFLDPTTLMLANNAMDDFNGPAKVLATLHLESGKIQTIPWKGASPYQVLSYGESLLVPQYSLGQSTDNSITVINPDTGKVTHRFPLAAPPNRSLVHGNIFYSIWDNQVYQYDIENNFKWIATHPLQPTGDLRLIDFWVRPD
ncbi:hypothetical protein F4V43_13170 [Paenibacillus spiritus]|uniref:YncE family protein n=1 Tax=Paenibacillus spiritus TaxID=2496557 RepID=A0A5J5G538_9BACL|nr:MULTISPECIES: hypothetical protein [Paenibacillus]KAA9002368.1 hypothetical protein F4V43_13170 [Paenibacillus spiritus]